MKILLSSHLFHPSVGGIEEVSLILAEEFHRGGHEVKIITQVAGPESRGFPFPVIRRPTIAQLLQAVRWCEVFFHNNISLRTAWPLLWVRRPWVIAHHIWISRMDGTLRWPDRLKRFLVRFATNISISRSIADHLPVSSTVIGDPYRDDLFHLRSDIQRDRDLVFLGRLVSDKGVDLLVESLARLRLDGRRPQLTIIGSGPEEDALRRLTLNQALGEQVQFVGTKRERELVELLNRHQILVVPSRWREPFGIVALEGIACGCVAVGSEGGGLKDAIGPCGMTFPNGDGAALTRLLAELLNHPERLAAFRANAPEHLARHRRSVVAKAYLEVLQSAVARGAKARSAGPREATASKSFPA